MATRRITGTLDTFSVNAGSEITYVGGSTTGDRSDDVRGFEVNPGSTGNIIVNLEKTSGIRTLQIFQKDAFGTGSAPTGYKKFFDIDKAGKGKGVVGVTVTNAAKDYVVLLTYDGYSEVSYNGTVDVP
jgi:hypothetical protein|tara:strand:+ start:695 stop:1078 length:384 start_codon:yes stop_codon:yes gene_type:complete